MDLWHAQVFVHGKVYDEDRVGVEAAKQWAEDKLREIDPNVQLEWRGSGDAYETGSSPDFCARVFRVPSTVPAKPSLIARLWRGEIPLVQAYWLYGVLLSVLFRTAGSVLLEAGFVLLWLLLWWPLSLAYYVLIVVAIWRSSERYQGPKIWSSLARISVMLGIAQTLLGMYLGLKYSF